MYAVLLNKLILHNRTANVPAPDSAKLNKLREIFSRIAGADGEIDSEELQDLLTASFTKGHRGNSFCWGFG